MANLANLHTDGNVKMLADLINETFQPVSADPPKLQPTQQHTVSILHDLYKPCPYNDDPWLAESQRYM